MRDIDIRRALRHQMELVHGNDPATLIVEEMGLCQGISRIDMAVVNGTVHGFEIKSDRDTLNRLASQIETYNRVFDFVTIVTARAHENNVRQAVPSWWGISVAAESINGLFLSTMRRPKRNRTVDAVALAQLLWRNEAIAALAGLGLVDGFRSKKREILWNRLAENVSLPGLSEIVRAALKHRPRPA